MARGLLLSLILAAALAQAQGEGERVQDLRAGRFLVASRKLTDPNFAETVILLIQYDEKGSMGLVVNRPSRIPVAQVLKEVPAAKSRTESAYSGGPVERGGALVLLRAKSRPEEAVSVLRGVYMLNSNKPLQAALTAGTKAPEMRVYLGYAGWGARQLDMETEVGAWHVLRADADSIFDPAPDSLWSRLIQETERNIARNFIRSGAPGSDRSELPDGPGR